MTPNEAVLELARACSRVCTLAMLTNNGLLLKEGFASVFPDAANLFGELAYFASEFGFAKPDPRLFEALAKRLELAPNEIVFVDDTKSYIEGASSIGINAHHFQGAEGLKARLQSLGVL